MVLAGRWNEDRLNGLVTRTINEEESTVVYKNGLMVSAAEDNSM